MVKNGTVLNPGLFCKVFYRWSTHYIEAFKSRLLNSFENLGKNRDISEYFIDIP